MATSVEDSSSAGASPEKVEGVGPEVEETSGSVKAEQAVLGSVKAEQAERAKAEQAERAKAEQAERAKAEQPERAKAEQPERAKAEQPERAKAEQAERAKAEQTERAKAARGRGQAVQAWTRHASWRPRAKRDGARNVMNEVGDVLDATSGWLDILKGIETETGRETPSRAAVENSLTKRPRPSLAAAARRFETADHTPGKGNRRPLAARQLVGSHVGSLVGDLNKAIAHWPQVPRSRERIAYDVVAANASKAYDAVMRVRMHALFLQLLDGIGGAHIGELYDADSTRAYWRGWELTQAQVEEMWSWAMTSDVTEARFAGRPVPASIDLTKGCIYRRPSGLRQWMYTLTAALWWGALVFGIVLGLFLLAHKAGVGTLTAGWVWRMLVLFVAVAIGAVAHLAVRWLSGIDYDEGLKIYNLGDIGDWLSMRWMGIGEAYIPVGVVTFLLWATGAYPTSTAATFTQLGSVFLAGFAADSTFRNVMLAATNRQKTSASEESKAATKGDIKAAIDAVVQNGAAHTGAGANGTSSLQTGTGVKA